VGSESNNVTDSERVECAPVYLVLTSWQVQNVLTISTVLMGTTTCICITDKKKHYYHYCHNSYL